MSRDTGEDWEFNGDFIGTVVVESTTGFIPLTQAECDGENYDHAITIEVEDGTRYAIGWRVQGPDGTDVTRAFGLVPGEIVGLHMDEACGEGCGNAFSVTRGDLLIGAISDGVWNTSIGGSATPGLTVTRGAEDGRYEEGCGTVGVHHLIFAGDTSVDLLPYSTASLSIGGRSYTVSAINAEAWVRATCTDLPDTTAWTAFADE